MDPIPRRIVAACGAALIIGGVTSCSEVTGGSPQPSDQSQAPGQSQPPTDDLAVGSPLDIEPFLNRPCDLVGKATVAEFGKMNAEPDVNSERAKNLTGPLCSWRSDDVRQPRFNVAIHVPQSEAAEEHLKGIRGIYAAREDSTTDYFEPVEIPGHPGYPAVITGGEVDKTTGDCPVFFGVTDTLTVVASVTVHGNHPEACKGSLKVAASVLETLKKGA